MSLSCLLSLGEGVTFHCFRKNPFRPAKPGHSPFLLSVRSINTQPTRPALDAQPVGQASRLSTGNRSTPATFDHHLPVTSPSLSLGRAEKVEALVLKLIVMILALASIGCGFGIQHIAYVRQKNALCRQLRQKEVELRTVTQAYRSLECCVAAKAADDFRRVEACPVIAKNAPRKVPTRG